MNEEASQVKGSMVLTGPLSTHHSAKQIAQKERHLILFEGCDPFLFLGNPRCLVGAVPWHRSESQP